MVSGDAGFFFLLPFFFFFLFRFNVLSMAARAYLLQRTNKGIRNSRWPGSSYATDFRTLPPIIQQESFTRGAGIRFKSNYTSEFRYKVRFYGPYIKTTAGRLDDCRDNSCHYSSINISFSFLFIDTFHSLLR